jgi:hypothetical protein
MEALHSTPKNLDLVLIEGGASRQDSKNEINVYEDLGFIAEKIAVFVSEYPHNDFSSVLTEIHGNILKLIRSNISKKEGLKLLNGLESRLGFLDNTSFNPTPAKLFGLKLFLESMKTESQVSLENTKIKMVEAGRDAIFRTLNKYFSQDAAQHIAPDAKLEQMVGDYQLLIESERSLDVEARKSIYKTHKDNLLKPILEEIEAESSLHRIQLENEVIRTKSGKKIIIRREKIGSVENSSTSAYIEFVNQHLAMAEADVISPMLLSRHDSKERRSAELLINYDLQGIREELIRNIQLSAREVLETLEVKGQAIDLAGEASQNPKLIHENDLRGPVVEELASGNLEKLLLEINSGINQAVDEPVDKYHDNGILQK